MKSPTIFFITTLLISFSIFSETILLKGNESIKGKIKNQSINSIKIEINGEIQEIPKDSILKIVYRDLSKLEEEKIRTEEETKSNNEKPQLKKGDDEKRNREEVSKQKMNWQWKEMD